MKLNELSDNPGARKARMRVGRGIGSGKGKTAGRGVKGQTSRSGVAIKGFEGGQMPIHRRLPKRGFNKPNAREYAELTLGKLEAAVTSGKIKAGETLTEDLLVERGVVRRKRNGIRLLAKGELTTRLALEVTGATRNAVAAVEKAGGTIKTAAPAQEASA
ncbi:MAG: 50S ribosomal protein L15 [Alphaproteobacteria bacterium]|nr:50S ribosomal protein L15 [Alphaproteobacteria bacterium]MDX5370210.1 50S ribosomal protein L15 [Alphaproteobacteria bacterium]MDX5464760.1 50S ribosomal protein L15 [Alphaproteobacteria bacterium]